MAWPSDQPKISIVTVSLNSERTIRETLDSVRNQQYQTVEHIVIDGGSRDGTLAIVDEFADSLAAVLSEPDSGVYDAMNKGIAMATGDVIGFVNSDDVFADRSVLSQIARIMVDPTIESCYGDLVYVSADKGRILRSWRPGPFRNGQFVQGWNPPHPTFYVRRGVYERFGGFDLSLSIGNDVVLMMKLLEKDGVTTYYAPNTWVRMRMGGISNKSFGNVFKQNLVIYRAAREMGLNPSVSRFAFGKARDRLGQIIQARRGL